MEIKDEYQQFINDVTQELCALSQFEEETFEYKHTYQSYKLSVPRQDNFLKVLIKDKILTQEDYNFVPRGALQDAVERVNGGSRPVASRTYSVSVERLDNFLAKYEVQKIPKRRAIYEKPAISKDGSKLTIDGVEIIIRPQDTDNTYSILAEVLFTSEELSVTAQDIVNAGNWEDKNDKELWKTVTNSVSDLNVKIKMETQKDTYVKTRKPKIFVNLKYLQE